MKGEKSAKFGGRPARGPFAESPAVAAFSRAGREWPAARASSEFAAPAGPPRLILLTFFAVSPARPPRTRCHLIVRARRRFRRRPPPRERAETPAVIAFEAA